jgi:hypothetical protein
LHGTVVLVVDVEVVELVLVELVVDDVLEDVVLVELVEVVLVARFSPGGPLWQWFVSPWPQPGWHTVVVELETESWLPAE